MSQGCCSRHTTRSSRGINVSRNTGRARGRMILRAPSLSFQGDKPKDRNTRGLRSAARITSDAVRTAERCAGSRTACPGCAAGYASADASKGSRTGTHRKGRCQKGVLSRIRGFFDPRPESILRPRMLLAACWQTCISRVEFEIWSRRGSQTFAVDGRRTDVPLGSKHPRIQERTIP